jgi:hypothetical protein
MLRLGVFWIEILLDYVTGVAILREAFDEAIMQLDCCDEESYKRAYDC